MSNVIQFPLQRKSTVQPEFTTVLNATDTLVFQADAVQYDDAAIQDLNKEAITDSAYMVWDLDTTAAMGAADGEYLLRYTALDTGAADHADWFEYEIESHDLIRVVADSLMLHQYCTQPNISWISQAIGDATLKH